GTREPYAEVALGGAEALLADQGPRRAGRRGGERPAGRAHLPRGGVRPGGDDRPFDDDEDAIRSANDTRYGLNAMVFTRDQSRAHRASTALRAGTVWVNCFVVRDLRAPFGGVGDSGYRPRGRHLQPRVLHRAQGRGHAGL